MEQMPVAPQQQAGAPAGMGLRRKLPCLCLLEIQVAVMLDWAAQGIPIEVLDACSPCNVGQVGDRGPKSLS